PRANLLFLNPSGIMSDAKTTQPKAMESTEEEPVHLPCNHSTIGGNEYIHWYRQIPHQGPEYLIHGLKDNTTNGMASLTIAKDRKSSTLILPRVTLRDAAVYYCIARDTHWDRWGCTCTLSAWWGTGSSSCHLM
ncbi:LV140 protein, partial [Crocuta crocuta]